jgi:serine/threonine-protein kinase
MITGQLPYVGASAAAIVDAKMKGSPEHARDRVPNKRLPDAVDDLLMRSLSRHPGLRFQTADEMRQALLQVLAAPARARSRRRAIGFSALASVMAFAAVLFTGKAHEIGQMLPTSFAFKTVTEQPALVVPMATDKPVVAENPTEASAAPVAAAEAPTPAEPSEADPVAFDEPDNEDVPNTELVVLDRNAEDTTVAAVEAPHKRRSPGASRARSTPSALEYEPEARPETPPESPDDFDIVVEEPDSTGEPPPRTVVRIEPAPAPIDANMVAGSNDAAANDSPTHQAQVLVEATADKPMAEAKPKSKARAGSNKDKDEHSRLRRKRKTRMASKVSEGGTSKPATKTK